MYSWHLGGTLALSKYLALAPCGPVEVQRVASYNAAASHLKFACVCRLGTVLDGKGNLTEANKLLTQSFTHFEKRLGPKNPLTGEAQFVLALNGARRMLHERHSGANSNPFIKYSAPQREQQLMQQMQKGLQAMQAGFGAEHMLVKKAVTDYETVKSALRTS